MIFIRFPFQSKLKLLDYGTCLSSKIYLIKQDIESYLGTDQFTLLYNGRPVHNTDVIPDGSNVQVIFSLPGGKGGFGSMLRAIGAQIEKTTNREACRDLSGRRLRDINEEQRLKKWISKEAEREAEKVRRRKERIERLKSKAPHKFFDFEYEKEISELPTRVNDALNEGLQKAKEPSKRPLEKAPTTAWLADDFPLSSSDSELEDKVSTNDGSPSKKLKLAHNFNPGCDSDISESEQSLPGPSKYRYVYDESSTSSDSKTVLTEAKGEEKSVISDVVRCMEEKTGSNDIGQTSEDTDELSSMKSNATDSEESSMDTCVKDVASASETAQVAQFGESSIENVSEAKKDEKDAISEAKPKDSRSSDAEEKDDSAIDLLDFGSMSELEALGLERLKSALTARGLKCGGTLRDRAERLWKVRGLQPHEFPAKFLAKSKK